MCPDKDLILKFTRNGDVPFSLNGIPFVSWKDVPVGISWNLVDGQSEIGEPHLLIPSGSYKKSASGVFIVEVDGRVWITHPSGAYGGYITTFPKGTLEEGLSLQSNAIKEAFEETGLKVEIIDHIIDVERTTTITRYYLARRIGGNPADMGWESEMVSLVPLNDLKKILNQKVDHVIVDAYCRKFNHFKSCEKRVF